MNVDPSGGTGPDRADGVAHEPAPDDAAHVVVAGVLVRGGRVLLCHRHPARRWYPDVWDLPGGHVEPGEDPVPALVRELHEELGVLAVPDPGTLATLTAADMSLTVLRVGWWSGEPTVVDRDEHDRLGWFTPGEAAGLRLADPAYPGLFRRALGAGVGA